MQRYLIPCLTFGIGFLVGAAVTSESDDLAARAASAKAAEYKESADYWRAAFAIEAEAARGGKEPMEP